MSTEARPRTRLVLGGGVVIGCLALPFSLASSLGLWPVCAVAPVQKCIARAGRTLAFALDGLAAWRRGALERARLRKKVAELTAQVELWKGRAADKDEQLRLLGDFAAHRQPFERHAEVIGEGAGPQSGLLFIDRGSRDNVEPGMVAVAGHSIVGTVRAVAPTVSSVLLVTSPGSAFDAQISTTREPGIVVGNGDGALRMKFVSQTEPEEGAAAVTRGRDGVTPRNFLLGRITRVERGSAALAYDISLEPVEPLDRLLHVVVVRPAISRAEFPQEDAETDE